MPGKISIMPVEISIMPYIFEVTTKPQTTIMCLAADLACAGH